jgi:hypothetical protein
MGAVQHIAVALDLDLRAERLERLKMCIQSPPSDPVAARTRDRDEATPRQQWPSEQRRGTNTPTKLDIRLLIANSARDEPPAAVAERFTLDTEPLQQFELCKINGSSVSNAAANNGSAAFLLPTGVIVPLSRWPPSITK